jgi:hypothetical protein
MTYHTRKKKTQRKHTRNKNPGHGHSRETDSTITTRILIINKYVNIQNNTLSGKLITMQDQGPTHQNKNTTEKL